MAEQHPLKANVVTFPGLQMPTYCSERSKVEGQGDGGRKTLALGRVVAPIPGFAAWHGE